MIPGHRLQPGLQLLGRMVVLLVALSNNLVAQSADPAGLAVRTSNRMGLDLYRQLAVKGQNLFLSPAGLAPLMPLLIEEDSSGPFSEKAGIAGKSRALWVSQLQSLPKEISFRKETQTAVLGASLWYQAGRELTPAAAGLARSLQMHVEQVDFARDRTAAARQICDWSNRLTEGKIPDFIGPANLPQDSQLFLASALYFNGLWKFPFRKPETDRSREPQPTSEEDVQHADNMDFLCPDGKKYPVIALRMDRPPLLKSVKSVAGFDAVELPYSAGGYSAILALPSDPAKAASTLRQGLTLRNLESLLARLDKAAESALEVEVPAFHVIARNHLGNALNELVLGEASDRRPELRHVLQGQPILLSDAVQEIDFDFSHKGTEASAKTAVPFTFAGPRVPVPLLRFDRAFLVILRHQPTGTLLFLGKLEDPRPQSSS